MQKPSTMRALFVAAALRLLPQSGAGAIIAGRVIDAISTNDRSRLGCSASMRVLGGNHEALGYHRDRAPSVARLNQSTSYRTVIGISRRIDLPLTVATISMV
jgi:hypothetical protein